MRLHLDASTLARPSGMDLDPDQRLVVDHRDGPLLVLAGPGTGKTTTIVESVVARIHSGQHPDSLLVLTFGSSAAEELRDRIALRLDGGLLPHVSTFHSFAFGLLRSTGPPDEYADPPRLMSGAEEEQRIREIIRGSIDDGSVAWPDSVADALRTRGFAAEVRSFIARMRTLDMSPRTLRRLARQRQRPEWAAVAEIAQQEAEIMVLQNVLDYGELIRRAIVRIADSEVRSRLHDRFCAIYVDEFQDTDVAQVDLLRSVAGKSCSVVAVGDPDQAIYRFRGADVQGILDFPQKFANANGRPARVVVLSTVRRFGLTIASAAQAALAPRALAGIPASVQRKHRSPTCVRSEGADPVRVMAAPSQRERDAGVAAQIRAAHVHEGVAWSDMAVLVRTTEDISGLRRALRWAGVPVSILTDETPLVAEPAVSKLIDVIEVAADASRVSSERVYELLRGPIGRLDAALMRQLGRAARDAARTERPGRSTAPGGDRQRDSQATVGEATPDRGGGLSSSDVVRSLVLDDDPWPIVLDPDGEVSRGVQRVRGVVKQTRTLIESGASVEEVLWVAWTGGSTLHGWPERLKADALSGSDTAHHDIDAVMALFDTAARWSNRYRGVFGVTAFVSTLRGQFLPAEQISERISRRVAQSQAVQVMTVHRAKGLEWSRVWVVGLEHGRWPNLRPRGSLLGIEHLSESEHVNDVDVLMRDERNLLYVACTRARDRLVLTTVDAEDHSESRASRFIGDVNRAGFSTHEMGSPGAVPSTWIDLVVDLRRAVMDQHSPLPEREEAANLLSQISEIKDVDGLLVAPSANPKHWWGVNSSTQGPRPVWVGDEPLAISGSSLEKIRACAMQWFLEHQVRAELPSGTAAAFGTVVHALAEAVAQGRVPPEVTDVDEWLGVAWTEASYAAAWQSTGEREQARRALERFLDYHGRSDRELLNTEQTLEAILDVPLPDGGVASVRLKGRLDRIEADENGDLLAIDLKTERSLPSGTKVAEHAQLGVYQLLLQSASPDRPSGGASLLQLRHDASAHDTGPKEQRQTAIPVGTDSWVVRDLGVAAEAIIREEFSAKPGTHCRSCAYASLCPARQVDVSVVPSPHGGESDDPE